jgi:nicotinamidase-related amidase
MITLPTASTALILLDLQKGAFAHQFAPYSGEAVLAKGKELARRFRVAKARWSWSTRPTPRTSATP